MEDEDEEDRRLLQLIEEEKRQPQISMPSHFPLQYQLCS